MAKLVSAGQFTYYARWWLGSVFGRKNALVNTMMINFQCNLKCKHCSVQGNADLLPEPHQLSYDIAKEEMQWGFDEGARVLFFEGGEPTLWKDGDKDLRDLIKAGRDIGYFVVGYTTNGTNVIYEDSDVISISLDGPRDVHDSIRGAGTYDKLMANLDKLSHPNIFANMVLMKDNKDALRRTVEAAAANKHIRGIMLNFITPPPHDQALSLDEKKALVDEALMLKKEGYPILNGTKALKEMLIEDYTELCPYWASAFVLPDCSHHYGCPMRGTESCKECGFTAVREYSLIVRGNPTAIREMSKRFAYSK
ncbi:MAG: molybdenum cofactor biosynthesis protein A [Methanomassiliicoccales archaeon PtaU1.Bin124]|nr:MAG: molybdenum cofactor biosynthesis protein A [Methanomassiliicoccales archaeon PtaU1.Bin124]